MVKKKRSSKTSSSSLVLPDFKSGQSAGDIRKTLKNKGGGNRDPEQLMLFDGDRATVSFVTDPNEWVEFEQIYLGQGPGGGYRIYTEQLYGEIEGRKPSTRWLIPMYVHQLYKAESGEYKARRENPEKIMFFVSSAETTNELLRRYRQRQNRMTDRIYVIERDGSGTDTKFPVDRTEDKPPREVKKAWSSYGKSTEDKLVEMFMKENAGKSSASDDDDDDEEDDYDHKVRRRRRGSTSSTKRTKRRSSTSTKKSSKRSRSRR